MRRKGADMEVVPIERLSEYVGGEVGVSEWYTVDQARVDAFADATLDHQFIHVDPEAARSTPWGTTIAHGFLTLSLIPYLTSRIGILPEGTVMAVNYGTDRVRFPEPVKVGSEIRARVVLSGVTERAPDQVMITSRVTIEIKGAEKPALVAETLSLFVTEVSP
jgi:acyl dehydratase